MYGSITPSSSSPGATASATAAPGRARSNTIGRAGAVSTACSAADSRHTAPTAATSGAITANGLSGRCFRSRSRFTAVGFVASHTRWKPPSPLTATMSPAASAACTVASTSASPSIRRPSRTAKIRGPQSGQQIGWAW